MKLFITPEDLEGSDQGYKDNPISPKFETGTFKQQTAKNFILKQDLNRKQIEDHQK